MSDGLALVLCSGGLDSSCLAAYLKFERSKKVYLLFIERGQRAQRWEYEAVAKISRFLEIEENILIASYNLPNIGNSHKRVTAAEETKGYISHPERNLVLVALGYGLASALNSPQVYIACNKDDDSLDAHKGFFEKVTSVLKTLKPEGEVVLPFVEWRKRDIIKWAFDESKLGNEFLKLTRSCWENEENHCGICNACRMRKEAFRDAGVADPTVYEI